VSNSPFEGLRFESPIDPKWILLAIAAMVVLRILLEMIPSRRRKRKVPRSAASRKKVPEKVNRSSRKVRPDVELLNSKLADLNGFEFERLMALYFRDNGYLVEEVGVGGNDGGVDLVLKDREGAKTAVQLKCYQDANIVRVQTVRELVGAKRNYGCLYALLITTSDLTRPAAAEAETLKVDYWHGGILRDRLRKWKRWQGDAS
jgi:restriction system protein